MVEDFRGRVLGGQFTIGELIGQGGYGWVYEARQASPDRVVAVKILRDRAVNPARARVSEAEALARAHHPNAVGVIAAGIEPDDGLMWIAMRLVDGTSLRAWFQSFGRMPLPDVVALVEQLAGALHAAHRRGIVHRDLKPENIMIASDDQGRLVATLLDFGIAKSKHDKAPPDVAETKGDDEASEPGEVRDGAVTSRGVASTSRTTRRRLRPRATPATPTTPSDGALGTVEYRPPEMAQDPRSAGPAADVYALGLITYEALAGHLPFGGGTKEEWRDAHERKPVPPFVDTPPGVFRAIHSALAKRPEDRPSPREFACELCAALVADPAEQIKTSARLWEARGRSPDLLWGPSAVAAAERRQQLAQNDVVSRAFLTASRRRAQATRWKTVAAVLVALLAAGAYRSYKNGETSEALVTQAESDQGGQFLLLGDAAEARRHLGEAYRRGDHSPGTQFMLARALQSRLAELAQLPASSGRAWSGAFSPDGKRIVTTDDKNAQVWDAQTFRLLFTLPHGDIVYQAVYSADGARIATACNDGAVRIWDAANGAPVRELRQGVKRLRYRKVAASPDGRYIAAIDAMGEVAHVWDANTGAPIAELKNDSSETASLAFSADGRWLASSGGNDVRVFNTDTWSRDVTIAGPDTLSLSWDPTGPRLATGTDGGDASIWEIPSGDRARHLREVGEPISALAFSPDGEILAVASRNGVEQVWRARSGKLGNQIDLHRGKILSVEFDSASTQVIAANADGSAVVVDAARGLPITVLEGPDRLAMVAHFDSSGRRAVVASWDGTARIWDTAASYIRTSLPASPSKMSIASPGREASPDGRRLVTVAADEAPPVLWDVEHNHVVTQLKGHVGRVWSAHFVSSGREILTAGADGTARLWDATTGKLRRIYRGSGNRYLADAVLAPDGTVVVAGDGGGMLQFWDAASGRPLWALQAHRSAVVGVRFQDGDIVTHDTTGDSARWTLPSPDAVIGACVNVRVCGIVLQ